ncbi:Man1-Src1p-C-terminal domain-containing protein [Suillus clintonianus]|uniref:Man1-Src1p-C-terminal domain-containing protein n=1 Tax=Suillus clintonianus TaxID=1904413 RepID=UPI001B8601CC|nr:Man1-Src1p-C-terminal domain-containing protein [Suillus clintonianus]KAG2157064.1 Man1-Src1p-C-terminal domain-containing protein [Suillus clintonianus]
MSRALSTAQVIGLGEYLNPEFDPATLTVSQLLGVLGYHNIRFPTPYTKPKLVQLFLDEIRPKAAKFKKDRLKNENSVASDNGITDGMTGKPLSGATQPRRSSRRVSRAPSDDDEPPPRPDPPKRRRSSAQPSLGGAHKTIARAAVQPAVIEESEPEDEKEDPPLRKVGRNKKSSQAAGSQARRISLADDSGWEDNNIFQSGGESSSPARPSPVRPQSARKGISIRKSRHSMSAPPQTSPSLSPPKAPFSGDLQRSPPQSKFEPELPPMISRQPRISTPSEKIRFSPIEHRARPSPSPQLISKVNARGLEFDDATGVFDDQTPDGSQSDDFGEPDSLEVAVPNRVADGDQLIRRRPAPPLQRSRSRFMTFLYLIMMVVASYLVTQYKDESSAIGYCDTGSDTNQALRDLEAQREAVRAGDKDNRTIIHLPSVISDTGLFEDGIFFPPFIPALQPSTCTPCPEFASCTRHSVVCNPSYVLQPHPILGILSPFGTVTPLVESIWSLIGYVTNGLPGLGPVAFPPRCSEDPKRKRNIGALGKAIEALLGQERGRRVCIGEKQGREIVKDNEGGEAKKWGLEVEILRNTMKRKTAPQLLATFDDTFNEAIQQLVQWGSVIFGEDNVGNRYLAHKTPHLTWNCQLTVKSRDLWEQWRASVYASIACVGAFYFIKRSRAHRQIEGRRVAELVQIALDTLRNQELAHHTDPVTAPHPYLSSLQLRDLILQDEHSISVRRRVWDQVERVVEGNANVRANLEEVQGGDELRVWRWVGSTGGPDFRKKVQFETQKDEVNANAL